MAIIHGEATLCKIVYWGPTFSGKGSNLRHLHASVTPDARGQLISLHAEDGNALLLDRFTPPIPAHVEGRKVAFQCCAPVGSLRHSDQVERALLRGLDGLVFVTDSQKLRRDANTYHLDRLQAHLGALGTSLDATPHVFQYNKRDHPDILPIDDLRADLNPHGAPDVEAIAFRGDGVVSTFRALLRILLPRLPLIP